MLIPIRCFTCSNLIANKYEKYLELLHKKKEDGNYNELTIDNSDIFKKLKLKRYCCKRMLLTHVPLIHIIKSKK